MPSPCSRLLRALGLSLWTLVGCALDRTAVAVGTDSSTHDLDGSLPDAEGHDASVLEDSGIDAAMPDASMPRPLLRGDGSFMRGSAASVADRLGVVRFVPPHTPRVDSTRPGLTLIEGTRENIVVASESLTNSAWVRPAWCTVTEDAASAPDGTMTADRQQVPNDAHCAFQTRMRAAVEYTLSAWFRSDTDGSIRARGAREAIVRASAPRAWLRLHATGMVAAARFDDVILDGRRTPDDPAIAQDVLSWGWQVEAGSFASSYVRTEDTVASRAPDVWVFAAGNVDAVLTSDRWSMVVEPEWSRDQLREPAWLVSFAIDAGLRFRRTGTLMLEAVVAGIPMAQVEVPEYALGDELRVDVDPRTGRIEITSRIDAREAFGAAWSWPVSGDLRLGGRVGGGEEIFGWISVPATP